MHEAQVVWFVQGEPDVGQPTLLWTKMDAEQYARYLFPDESPDRRYARVFYRPIYTFEEAAAMT